MTEPSPVTPLTYLACVAHFCKSEAAQVERTLKTEVMSPEKHLAHAHVADFMNEGYRVAMTKLIELKQKEEQEC